MKRILISLLNAVLLSYIFYFAPYNINFFLLILLAIIYTLTTKYVALLTIVPLLFLHEYHLCLIMLGVICTSYFGGFYLKKNIYTLSIGTILTMFIALAIHYSLTNLPINGAFFIIGGCTSIISLLFFINISYYTDEANKAQIAIISPKLYDTLFLALAYSIVLLSKLDYSYLFIIYILISLRYISDKYTFIFIALLNLVLNIRFFQGEHLIHYLIISLCFFNAELHSAILALAITAIFGYLNKAEYLITSYFIIVEFISIILFYRKGNIQKIDYQKMAINKITAYTQYIDLTKKELSYNNANNLLDKRIANVIEHYCGDCIEYKNCLHKKKSFTYAFFKLALTSNIDINEVNISHELRKFILACPNYLDICALDKIKGSSNLSFESLDETKKILDSLSTNLTLLPNNYQKFITHLQNLGYNISSFDVVAVDSLLEIYVVISDITPSYALNVINKQASLYFKKEMQTHILKQSTNTTTFKIVYKPRLKVMFDHYSLAKDSNQVSGDNFIAKRDLNGRYIFALSDGMGSGIRAFNESSEMLKMVKEITKLNFGIKSSIDLLDSYYAYKEHTEMFATLDFLQIDSVNLTANLYKLGATNTYLLSKGQLKIFYNTNLPLGVKSLKDEYNFKLHKTDLILMVSDGVTEHTDLSLFQNFLLKIAYKPVNKIVSSVLEYICGSSKQKLADDLSVIAIKIC